MSKKEYKPETMDLDAFFSQFSADRMELIRVRFWAKVEKSDGCWVWIGFKRHSGYGYYWPTQASGEVVKSLFAHRVSLYLSGVVLPLGLVADHICRNRACVKPEHLRLVTSRENTLENSLNVAALNKQKTHCLHGHEFNDLNTRNYYKKTGSPARRCISCEKKYQADYYKNNRGKAVTLPLE